MTNNSSGDGAAAMQQLLCAAILFMPMAYMGVVVAMQFSGSLPEQGFGGFDDQFALVLTGIFLATGLSAAVFSMFLKKRLIRGDDDTGVIDGKTRFKAVLLAMVLSESGAVMGLVLMLLTGNMVYGALLCGISCAITCFHFPSRHWLENGDDPL
jgi:hypothetical protein